MHVLSFCQIQLYAEVVESLVGSSDHLGCCLPKLYHRRMPDSVSLFFASIYGGI